MIFSQIPLGEIDQRLVQFIQYGADECWPWPGPKDRCGYGRVRVGSRVDGSRRLMQAHRWVYQQLVGDTDAPQLCHTCDNPACCNPKHLYPGDARANAADRDRRGRRVLKLTRQDAETIRRKHVPGRGGNRKQLAKEYGVSPATISHVISRRTFR